MSTHAPTNTVPKIESKTSSENRTSETDAPESDAPENDAPESDAPESDAPSNLPDRSEGLVPIDRNSGERWQRFGYSFKYPSFDTEANRGRLEEKHVFRFPEWTTTLTKTIGRLEATYASAKDPASVSRIEPQARGVFEPNDEEKRVIAGKIAVMFAREEEREEAESWKTRHTHKKELELERTWRTAWKIVTGISEFRKAYGRLQMLTNKLIRRKGRSPSTYLQHVEKRVQQVLEEYFTAREALLGVDGKVDGQDARMKYADITRPTIPSIRKGKYEVPVS